MRVEPVKMPSFKSSALAFCAGVALASLATSLLFLRWHRQQERLLWTSFLDQHLRTIRNLQNGDVSKVQADLDARLPGLVQSVSSFGPDPSTQPVLNSASEYLRDVSKFNQ